jgi:apolipoprotein N-acyltransferase
VGKSDNPAVLRAREIEKLTGKPRLKVWLIALASAPLLTLTVPPWAVPGLVFFALVPLLLALPRLSAGGSWLAGFIVGMCYFWIDLWWLGQMSTGPGQEIAIFGMFAFVATAMAAYYGVCCMCLRWVLTRQAMWLAWLVPLIWLGFEFAHEFDTPAPFPWMSVSQGTLALTSLIQVADIVGSYGLVLLVIFVALACVAPFELAGPNATFARKRTGSARFAMPVVALVLVIGGCIYGQIRIGQIEAREKQGPLIGCVQGNLKQEVKVSNDPEKIPRAFREHLDLSGEAAEKGADLIVWPETMLFGGATREGLTYNFPELAMEEYDGIKPSPMMLGPVRPRTGFIGRLRAEIYYRLKKPMLVGVLSRVPKEEQSSEFVDYKFRQYNTALLLGDDGHPMDSYDKRFLVPGGEYIPREDNWAIRKIVIGYAESLQGKIPPLVPGKRLTLFALPINGREWHFTTSICYEYVWPQCYVDLHNQPDGGYPDFHLNISNEGWFKQSAELDMAIDYCKLRCIESRMPMVRATNTGISCTIDATGRVREMLTVNGKYREVGGVFLSRPPVLSEPSPTFFIAHVGRLPGWLSLCVIIPIMALMAIGRWQARQERRRAKVA